MGANWRQRLAAGVKLSDEVALEDLVNFAILPRERQEMQQGGLGIGNFERLIGESDHGKASGGDV